MLTQSRRGNVVEGEGAVRLAFQRAEQALRPVVEFQKAYGVQIYIGEFHVGGFDDLAALDKAGKLEPMLRQCNP